MTQHLIPNRPEDQNQQFGLIATTSASESTLKLELTFDPLRGSGCQLLKTSDLMRLHLLLLFLRLHPLTSDDLDEVDQVPVEVIVKNTPCSATCGLGVQTQTLCFLRDGHRAMEEGVRHKAEVETSHTPNG